MNDVTSSLGIEIREAARNDSEDFQEETVYFLLRPLLER